MTSFSLGCQKCFYYGDFQEEMFMEQPLGSVAQGESSGMYVSTQIFIWPYAVSQGLVRKIQ